jgi:hypothetical protein
MAYMGFQPYKEKSGSYQHRTSEPIYELGRRHVIRAEYFLYPVFALVDEN